MNWTVGFVLAVGLVLPVGLGLGLGAYRAAQSPTFMAGAAALLLKAVVPILAEFAAKRNAPEIEARMKDVSHRAGEWDNFNKRERER